MLSSHKRHPCRPIGFNNRKIEHIYHFPVKPTGISPVVGHERGYLRMGTFIENDTIENTVDDISQSARQNQGNTNDISGFQSSFDNFVKIPADKSDGKNTKSSQKELSDKFHTESHPVILSKINIKPIGHSDTFVPIHVSFNPYFDYLVDNQHRKDNEQGRSPFRKKFLHHF